MATARIRQVKKVRCPCCGKQRAIAGLMRQEALIAAHNATPWWAKPGWTGGLAKTNELRWACAECLHARRAIPANPWLQTFCDHAPFLAYFDEVDNCHDCGKQFIFGAAEQRYWYEQLKFLVQSHPKHCPTCRRTRRQRSRAQAELVTVLKNLDQKDPVQLGNAAATMLAAGSRRKAAEFLRRAKNLTRDETLRTQLIKQLESVENH